MFIVGFLSWWYGDGWLRRVVRVRDGLLSTYDYFSLDLLLRTLFSPFRQISAGKVRGPITVQIRAMLDNLMSRCIGAAVRSLVILVGSLTLAVSCCLGALRLIIWPLIPIVPIACVVCALLGWIPWTI